MPKPEPNMKHILMKSQTPNPRLDRVDPALIFLGWVGYLAYPILFDILGHSYMFLILSKYFERMV